MYKAQGPVEVEMEKASFMPKHNEESKREEIVLFQVEDTIVEEPIFAIQQLTYSLQAAPDYEAHKEPEDYFEPHENQLALDLDLVMEAPLSKDVPTEQLSAPNPQATKEEKNKRIVAPLSKQLTFEEIFGENVGRN